MGYCVSLNDHGSADGLDTYIIFFFVFSPNHLLPNGQKIQINFNFAIQHAYNILKIGQCVEKGVS